MVFRIAESWKYLLFIGLACVAVSYYNKSLKASSNDSRFFVDYQSRNLRQNTKEKKQPPNHPALSGTSSLITNSTVYGAVILSDADWLYGIHNEPVHVTTIAVGSNATESKITQSKNTASKKSIHQLHKLRMEHVKTMSREIPVPLVYWPAVYAKPCPQHKHDKDFDRGGLSIAHHQIWSDFEYFDFDVINEYRRGAVKGKGIYSSTTWTSTSALFQAAENGTLYKNGREYRDNDILVVFEDDAIAAVRNISETITAELGKMAASDIDVLYLGWCRRFDLATESFSRFPQCTHAYALTRLGARKLLKYYDICGKSLDAQMSYFIANGYITYRALEATEDQLLPAAAELIKSEVLGNATEQSRGIFHQSKVLELPN